MTAATRTIERTAISRGTLYRLLRVAKNLNATIKRLDLDVPEVAVTSVPFYTVKRRDEWGALITHNVTDASVTAPDLDNLIIDGYELVGVVSHAADRADVQGADAAECRIVTTMVEDLDLSHLRDGTLTCTECGKARTRHTLLVLRDEAGELSWVGGACAAKYLPRGANSIKAMEWMHDLDAPERDSDYDERAPRAEHPLYTSSLLALVIRWLDCHGYVSQAASGPDRMSTSAEILALLTALDVSPHCRDKYQRAMVAELDKSRLTLDEAEAKAEEVMDWAKGLSPRGDFEANLKAALASPIATRRNFGLIVCASSVMDKTIERQREAAKARAEAKAAGSHYGTVGVRFDGAAGVVDGVTPSESFYGTSYRVKITLDTGSQLVWWATRRPSDEIKEGTKVSVRATVKRHDEYKGVPQTIVNRAVLTPVS